MVSVVAMGVIMTSVVGCTSSSQVAGKQETTKTEVTSGRGDLSNSKLDDLTITHVTSPLNVPSIIQKNTNVFSDEFSKNGKTVKIKYAEITSGADQTQALASGDIDVLYAVGGTSVVLAAANGADIKILNMYSRSPEAFCL